MVVEAKGPEFFYDNDLYCDNIIQYKGSFKYDVGKKRCRGHC